MVGFPGGFENALGVYAFLCLIPFILIYLIRPKPKSMEIPSLMFFMKARSADKQKSFLRFLRVDWIFWLQLFSILFLSAAITAPFLEANQDVVSDNMVFIIDGSASSKVGNGITRFDNAVKEAKRILGKENTVIVVKGSSAIGVKGKNSRETESYINGLKPTDTRSKIGDAILLSGELLKDNKGRVVVLSDFVNTEGTPPEIASNILKSKGVDVEFINLLEGKKKNYGIIDVRVDEENTVLYIKNYNDKDATLELEVNGEKRNVAVKAGSIETYKFKTPFGITKVQILNEDDFYVDNFAYISGPEEKPINVALITNGDALFLKSALNSLRNVKTDVFEPPIFPKERYDIYIMHDVEPDKVITGSTDNIQERIEDGSAFIIYSQQGIRSIDFKDLNPVGLKDYKETGLVTIDLLNRVTKNIDFGIVNGYYDGILKEESVSLASVNNASVIAFKNVGIGKSGYYGILDDTSDFKLSPNYPIFWNNMIRFLTNQKEVSSLNFRTGDVLSLENENLIKTPSGRNVKTKTLYLEEIGIYEYGDTKIAVNLASEAESNINGEKKLGKDFTDFVLEPVKEKVKINLVDYLIILIGLLLLIEILIAKIRGDL